MRWFRVISKGSVYYNQIFLESDPCSGEFIGISLMINGRPNWFDYSEVEEVYNT